MVICALKYEANSRNPTAVSTVRVFERKKTADSFSFRVEWKTSEDCKIPKMQLNLHSLYFLYLYFFFCFLLTFEKQEKDWYIENIARQPKSKEIAFFVSSSVCMTWSGFIFLLFLATVALCEIYFELHLSFPATTRWSALYKPKYMWIILLVRSCECITTYGDVSTVTFISVEMFKTVYDSARLETSSSVWIIRLSLTPWHWADSPTTAFGVRDPHTV